MCVDWVEVHSISLWDTSLLIPMPEAGSFKNHLSKITPKSCPPLVGILKGSLLYFVKHAVTLWGFSNTVPEDGSQDLTFYWVLLRPEHTSWLEVSNTSKFRVVSNCIRKADRIFSAVTGAIKEKKLTKLIRLPVSFLP